MEKGTEGHTHHTDMLCSTPAVLQKIKFVATYNSQEVLPKSLNCSKNHELGSTGAVSCLAQLLKLSAGHPSRQVHVSSLLWSHHSLLPAT